MNFQSFRWDKYSWKPSTYVIASGSSISTSAASAGIPLILIASASTLSTSSLSAIQKMSMEAHGGSFNFAWDSLQWNGFGWYVDPFSRAYATAVLRDTESLWGSSGSSAAAIVSHQRVLSAAADSLSSATISPLMQWALVGSLNSVSSALLFSNQFNIQVSYPYWRYIDIVKIKVNGQWKNVSQIQVSTPQGWKTI